MASEMADANRNSTGKSETSPGNQRWYRWYRSNYYHRFILPCTDWYRKPDRRRSTGMGKFT